METKIIYRYDDLGYFEGDSIFQIGPGIEMPNNTTEVAPPEDADFQANFYRFDGGVWKPEAKPTKAEDLLGQIVSHDTKTRHDIELRSLIQKLGRTEGYKIERGDALEWQIVKIPQEVYDAREIDAELSEFDSKLNDLKDRMATAMLQNDQETITTLRAEYQALMNGDE